MSFRYLAAVRKIKTPETDVKISDTIPYDVGLSIYIACTNVFLIITVVTIHNTLDVEGYLLQSPSAEF